MKPRHLLAWAILAAAAYFVVFGGEHSLYELWRIERQHKAELESLEILRDSLARLNARLDSLENDDAMLERIARERYGLIRPGERLYLFVEPPDSAEAAADRDSLEGSPKEESERPPP